MKKFTRQWIVLFAVLSAAGAYAQQTGEITGTVADSSGAVVAGATITATNTATQQVRNVVTNATGIYSLPFLPPGIYSLRAEKSGFKEMTHDGINVEVGGVARIDFSMQVGEVSQKVVVTTGEPLVNTETASLGAVIGNQRIVQLPLNGRDYLSLVALSPNVINEAPSTGSSGLQGGVRSSSSLAVAGQRLEFNHYTLDGVENTDPNFNSYIIHPSIDAIQEFRVQTGVYSAEFGQGAAQINVTTKSGTNSYHLVAFEFLRNSAFDAREWRQTGKKNPFRRNDYGFTLGGPVSIPKIFDGKDKLFFSSNFEALRDRLTTQQVASVGTDRMRSGDFSASGIPQIYDPGTRVYTGASTGTATHFAGNVIPTSRLSPQAIALLKYYPEPTYPGDNLLGPNGIGNLVVNSVSPTNSTQFNQRIDWVQNQKSSWFGRFSWGGDDVASVTPFLQANTTYVDTTVRQVALGNTLIISPTIVNEARFGWSQFNNTKAGFFANKFNLQASLGIDGLHAGGPSAYGVPAIGLSEGINSFGGVEPYVTRDDLFQWVDSLSIVRGAHSMKLGGQIGRDRYNQNGNQKSEGELDFDGQSTNNPGNPGNTGYSFADFMLGQLSQYYRVTTMANAELRRTSFALFFQDDWKLSPKLTVNLGVRYENERPWEDKFGNQINPQIKSIGVSSGKGGIGITPVSTLIPDSPSPILTRPGTGDFYQGIGFRYAQGQPVQRGNQYMGKALVDPNNLNWGPRVGIAYSPDQNWSFRAGFGMFYAQDIGNAVFDMSRNLGGKDGTVISPQQRTVNLTSPWSGETGSPLCPGYNGVCVVAPQVQGNWQHARTAYIEQYLFNVQRQLSQNVVFELGYLGNEGHRLGRDFIVNQAVPKSGPTDTSSTTSRRPFPSFGPIQEMADFDNATYNSLSVSISQRFSHGLSYTAAFTWSKSLDSGSALRNNQGDTLWPTNSYNLAAERGPSQFNLPHRFVANFLYMLPLGQGQPFINHGIAGGILGGWQVGGILTLADGTSINVAQLGDTAGLGTLGNQPDYTGVSPIPANRSAAHYWNPAAFNFTSSALSYRPGTMSRDSLFTPGSETFDSSLVRDIHLWEAHTLTFRFEAFNTLNRPNWNAPSSDARNLATFGVVTSAGTMRELQLALKYSF